MEQFIVWFNNSSFLSFLFTPWRIKRFWRTSQRVRICECCEEIDKNVHWSKDDHLENGKMVYSHTWLCDKCFYADIFKVNK